MLVPLAGTVVVILSALYSAGLLLRSASSSDSVDAVLCELLVTELATDQPQLLPRRSLPAPLLTHTPQEEHERFREADESSAITAEAAEAEQEFWRAEWNDYQQAFNGEFC